MNNISFSNLFAPTAFTSFSKSPQAPTLPTTMTNDSEVPPPMTRQSSNGSNGRTSSRRSGTKSKSSSSRKSSHRTRNNSGDWPMALSDRSNDTKNTLPDSSASTLGDDSSEGKIGKFHGKKEAFDKIQAEVRRADSIKPVSWERKQPRIPIRRTKSEGTSLTEKMLLASRSSPANNNTRQSVVSSSMRSPKPLARKSVMVDDSRKTMDNSNAAWPSTRRTMSNRSTNNQQRRSQRRGTTRESIQGKMRAVAGDRSSVADSRPGDDLKRQISNNSVNSRSSGGVPPEMTWECDCGQSLKDRMNFCGFCGNQKHWTCDECLFDENLCRFAFCGHCGVPRDESLKPEQVFGKLVTTFE